MRKIRIISALAFLIALFINIDLSMNFYYSLLPELQDGISSHSILQATLGIFGDSGWTRVEFFRTYERVQWLTFGLFVENIILAFIGLRKLSKNAE